MGRIRTTLMATAAAAFAVLIAAAPSSAVVDGPPSQTPATFTPWLLTSPVSQVVQELVPCGANMYAVGTISRIGQGNKTYTRGNAFSFSQTTGAMTAWDPQIDGMVQSIALSPDCSTAYLGGSFTSARGTAVSNLVAVNTTTGAVASGFAHSANNKVFTVRYTSRGLLVGGLFTNVNGAGRTRFASLDPTTGAVTSYANLTFAGNYAGTNGGTEVFNSQLSHSGTKLFIQGIFTSIAGQARRQVAVLDLGATSVTVNPWYSAEFDQDCIQRQSFYIHSGAWSPDDGTLYTAATGYKPLSGPGSSTGDPRAQLCDSVAAFPATSGTVSHRWVNYTGCDSLYAVAADANDVYIGGHERWANNPNGCDAAGPGAVSRQGLGAIDPTTGLANSWNPTRSLGVGVQGLTVTSAGLWVASDTFSNGGSQQCGGQSRHGGICFLPY